MTKRAKTPAEKRHLARVVELGCIVCRDLGYGMTPAVPHHIRTGQGAKRAGHGLVIPLCPNHHLDGGFGTAFHSGRKTWEGNFGTELSFLNAVILLLEE